MDAKEFNKLLRNIHNNECLKRIYEEFYPIIVKFIISNFSNMDLAKDVAHDVFMELINNDYEYIRDPKSYILRTAKNIAIKYTKNEKNNTGIDESQPYYFITDIYDKIEINNRLSKLEAGEREIIELKWFHGYNLKEIAEMKGCSLFAMQKKHQRILKKLEELE